MSLLDFLRPAWRHSHYDTRLHAVRNGSYSQLTLATIAGKARDPALQADAVDRLTDESLLARIARTHRSDDIRCRAAVRLGHLPAGQAILTELATRSQDEAVRVTAACRMDDQAAAQRVLAQIATKGQNAAARLRAAANLSDHDLGNSIVAELAESCPDEHVQFEAIEKLTDQERLARIASQLEASHLGLHAARRITRPDLLRAVATRVPREWLEGERGDTLLAQIRSCRRWPTAEGNACHYFEFGLCLFRLLGKKQEFQAESCSAATHDYHDCHVWAIAPVCRIRRCEKCQRVARGIHPTQLWT